MSKINLKNIIGEQSETPVIFNDGEAGRVENVAVSVNKKTAGDSPNAPDVKIFFTQPETGASVNLGVYYPTDRTTDKEVQIRVDQLFNIWRSLDNNASLDNVPEFDTPTQLYEFLITQIARNTKAGLVNLFVTYGTIGKPSRYLTIRAYNVVEPARTAAGTSRLKPNVYDKSDTRRYPYTDLMEPVMQTDTSTLVSDDAPAVTQEEGGFDWED